MVDGVGDTGGTGFPAERAPDVQKQVTRKIESLGFRGQWDADIGEFVALQRRLNDGERRMATLRKGITEERLLIGRLREEMDRLTGLSIGAFEDFHKEIAVRRTELAEMREELAKNREDIQHVEVELAESRRQAVEERRSFPDGR